MFADRVDAADALAWARMFADRLETGGRADRAVGQMAHFPPLIFRDLALIVRMEELIPHFANRRFGVVQESVKFARVETIEPFSHQVAAVSGCAPNVFAKSEIARARYCCDKRVHLPLQFTRKLPNIEFFGSSRASHALFSVQGPCHRTQNPGTQYHQNPAPSTQNRCESCSTILC